MAVSLSTFWFNNTVFTSSFQQLWMKLLNRLESDFFVGIKFSDQLGKCFGAWLLDYIVRVYLAQWYILANISSICCHILKFQPNSMPLLFWFVIPWQQIMLCIFSYAYIFHVHLYCCGAQVFGLVCFLVEFYFPLFLNKVSKKQLPRKYVFEES